uniref:Uncharacterized protein n=1 Tax=Solanum tuberosum TaxID=4113 RepID=M1DAJ6_SOLTU
MPLPVAALARYRQSPSVPANASCPSLPLLFVKAETVDDVQIAAMSAQITELTSALIEFERRRVAEQQSMSATVQQIKEQVLNLAHRPTTSSAPKDTDGQ